MHILIYSDDETFLQKYQEQITSCDKTIQLTVTHTPTPEQLNAVEVLLPMHNFSKLSLSAMPNLRWVHTMTAGVNGVVEKIKDTDIILTNSSGVHPIPISEQIFGYLLMFARDMHTTQKNQIKKVWDKKNLSVFELYGKTISIIGLGRIGEKTAQLAKAFGMKVLAVRTHKIPAENVDEVYTLSELDTVLGLSDFVVNCLPGTDATHGLYTLEKFKHMKPTSYFINIGRGLSLNEADLVTALQEKIIAGAGLDVFEIEPLPATSPLWEMANVILTPHSAGITPEYMNRVISIFCENLKAYVSQQPLPNEVDKEKGY
ncbi:D-2-hydroxyacid dehydrogenase [soil metagenome]